MDVCYSSHSNIHFYTFMNNPSFVRDLRGQRIFDPTLRPCPVSLQKEWGTQILIMQTILVPSPPALGPGHTDCVL